MSADALKRLSLGNKWAPADWHLALANELAKKMTEIAASNTVYGIFRAAVLRRGNEKLGEDARKTYLQLINDRQRRLAEPHLAALSAALGEDVLLCAKVPLKSPAQDREFEREMQARQHRLKVKPKNTGVHQ